MPYFYNEYKRYIQIFKDRVEQSVYKNIEKLRISAWVTKEPVPFEKKLSGKEIGLGIGDSWGELCLFDEKGCPVQGLTNVSSEFDLSLGKPGKSVIDTDNSCDNATEINSFIRGDSGSVILQFATC